MKRSAILAPLLLVGTFASQAAFSQGCVVTRGAGMASEHFGIQDLLDSEEAPARFAIATAYRSLHSHRHFVGSEEQHERREQGSQVINNSDFIDIAFTYSFSPRTSATFTVPLVMHDRSQVVRANDAQRTILHRFHTQSSGIGDVRLTGNMWVTDPTTHPKRNLLVGLGLDAPTGDKDVEDTFEVYNNSTRTIGTVRRTVDQSIQPGDGGWGITLDLYGYWQVTHRAMFYASGYYSVTPEETSGVQTFRSNPFESEMSIADSFMARAGMQYLFTPSFLDNMIVSLGARVEGVPVHDLTGGSEGFRRPGYAVSVEPGLSAQRGEWSATLHAPIAVYRNRTRSVADHRWTEATGVFRHGDAAFADALVMFSINKRFGRIDVPVMTPVGSSVSAN